MNKGKKRDAANRLVQTALSTHYERITCNTHTRSQQKRKLFLRFSYTAGLEGKRETHKLRKKGRLLPKGYSMKDVCVTKR